MPEVVFDTCVISNFTLAEAFGVIEDLYRGRAHIPEFVAAEITRGIQAGNARLAAVPKAVRAGWLKETGLRSRAEKALFESKVARAEAVRLGVPVTGTVGILVKAVRRGVCDGRAADSYLEKMIDAGFFSPVGSIRGLLRYFTDEKDAV